MSNSIPAILSPRGNVYREIYRRRVRLRRGLNSDQGSSWTKSAVNIARIATPPSTPP